MKTVKAWIGIVNGRPYIERSYDAYCGLGETVKIIEAFRSRRAASKRFAQYRQVEIRELPPAPARRSRKAGR